MWLVSVIPLAVTDRICATFKQGNVTAYPMSRGENVMNVKQVGGIYNLEKVANDAVVTWMARLGELATGQRDSVFASQVLGVSVVKNAYKAIGVKTMLDVDNVTLVIRQVTFVIPRQEDAYVPQTRREKIVKSAQLDFGVIRPLLDVNLAIAVFMEVFSRNVTQTQADVCAKWVMRVGNVISVDLVITGTQLANLVSVMLQEHLRVNVVERMALVLVIQLRDSVSVSLT